MLYLRDNILANRSAEIIRMLQAKGKLEDLFLFTDKYYSRDGRSEDTTGTNIKYVTKRFEDFLRIIFEGVNVHRILNIVRVTEDLVHNVELLLLTSADMKEFIMFHVDLHTIYVVKPFVGKNDGQMLIPVMDTAPFITWAISDNPIPLYTFLQHLKEYKNETFNLSPEFENLNCLDAFEKIIGTIVKPYYEKIIPLLSGPEFFVPYTDAYDYSYAKMIVEDESDPMSRVDEGLHSLITKKLSSVFDDFGNESKELRHVWNTTKDPISEEQITTLANSAYMPISILQPIESSENNSDMNYKTLTIDIHSEPFTEHSKKMKNRYTIVLKNPHSMYEDNNGPRSLIVLNSNINMYNITLPDYVVNNKKNLTIFNVDEDGKFKELDIVDIFDVSINANYYRDKDVENADMPGILNVVKDTIDSHGNESVTLSFSNSKTVDLNSAYLKNKIYVDVSTESAILKQIFSKDSVDLVRYYGVRGFHTIKNILGPIFRLPKDVAVDVYKAARQYVFPDLGSYDKDISLDMQAKVYEDNCSVLTEKLKYWVTVLSTSAVALFVLGNIWFGLIAFIIMKKCAKEMRIKAIERVENQLDDMIERTGTRLENAKSEGKYADQDKLIHQKNMYIYARKRILQMKQSAYGEKSFKETSKEYDNFNDNTGGY